MSEIKEYEITAIADLLKVPDDKLDDCLADLKIWLGVRKTYDELPDVFRELVTLQDTMTWKDDGIRGVSEIKINIHSKG